jgi:hypothetical protein
MWFLGFLVFSIKKKKRLPLFIFFQRAWQVVVFLVLRLLLVAGWLWLEFQHTNVKEKTLKPTPPKKQYSPVL